ncbi:MAG: pyridoxamine 5-phosphate oxidase [Gammaproteobacteria bacterium]|nr:pyridoxamine 5-phosphate oxidase [Gammaproteobacteria bacterium]
MAENNHIPLACSSWDDKESKAIEDVVNSGIFTMGSKVQEFEESFANYHNSKYCVMVNSGSSANFLMIAALFFTKGKFRLKRGDEIIVPSVSWSTSYSPIYFHGLKLRFVDVDSKTLNINTDNIKEAITPNTKGILAVNLLGNSCEYNEIVSICNENDLILLEDNCESLGGSYNNQKTGTFGLVSSCSSFFSHHISTMEGGLILTDDEEIYHILLSIRAHGWTRNLPENNLICNKSEDPFYESFRFILPGYNVRPLELSGALGIEQIKKLDDLISKRRSNAEIFQNMMKDFDFIDIQEESGSSSWFGFGMVLNERAKFSRGSFIEKLKDGGIETRPIVCGNILENEMTEYFDYSTYGDFTVSEKIHKDGLFVGNHHIDIKAGLENLHDCICQLAK